VLLVGIKDSKSLIDSKYRRDPHQDINIQRELLVLLDPFAPAVVSGARRIAKDKKALLLVKAPMIGNSQKGSQARRAEAPSVDRIEPIQFRLLSDYASQVVGS
jgi:hypothetical protein